jgi:hypothetical protein
MRVLSDCPTAISLWQEFRSATLRPADLNAVEAGVWHALAGRQSAIELVGGQSLPSDALMVVIGHSGQSQFDLLHELMRSGAALPSQIVALALTGEDFHGQGHRPWRAVAGNLHLTVYHRTSLPAADAVGAVSILPTLAVMDAFDIVARPAERTGIRWLNDVFLQGKKLAGSIAATATEGDRMEGVLFGVGINVEAVPDLSGDGFVPEVTGLAAADPEAGWTLGRAVFNLLPALFARIEALCPPLAQGRVLSITRSLAVCLEGCEPIPEGRLVFVDSHPTAAG